MTRGARPAVADVQPHFVSLSALETAHRPVRFRDSQESLLDLGTRMLAVLCAQVPDATEVVAVESAFAVPLWTRPRGSALSGLAPAVGPKLSRITKLASALTGD